MHLHEVYEKEVGHKHGEKRRKKLHKKEESSGKIAVALGSGEMASHHALDVRFEVRILAPQLQKVLRFGGFFFSNNKHGMLNAITWNR